MMKKKIAVPLTMAGILMMMDLPAAAASAKPAELLEQTIANDGAAAYAGKFWRIDAQDKAALPRNFRTTRSVYRQPDQKNGFQPGYVPTRAGLDTLDASGSAQYSVQEFGVMAKQLKQLAKGPVYIIDLRQESHGFLNGEAVSWYGKHDWGNVGKSHQAVLQDEKDRLQAAAGKLVQVSPLNDRKEAAALRFVRASVVMTEAELVKQAGFHYVRITATDHVWPSDANIDDFIKLYRQLPPQAWLHFHCEAGMGRTTTYMSMYDMMRNPSLSLQDILYRQHMLGGNYVGYRAQAGKGSWKAPYYNEKADMIKKFYAYVQANQADGYRVPWSEWSCQH
jgi:hypothetical protein